MTTLIISVVAMGVVVLLGVIVRHNHRIRRNNLLRKAFELGKQCAAIEWWAEQDAEIVMKDASPSSPEQDIMDIVSPPPKVRRKASPSPTVTPWKKDNAKKNNKQA